jgi:hypothetical protein
VHLRRAIWQKGWRKQHEIGIIRLTDDFFDLVHNLPAHNRLKNVRLGRKKKRAAELSFFGNLGEIA